MDQTFKIERKDFLTCWKALSHSENIFKEAIQREDYPRGASEREFLGYLEDIRITKEKIGALIWAPPVEVH